MKTSETTSLHNDYRATYELGNQLIQFDRSEMIQMTRAPRAQLTTYEVRDLKIKILEQTENFATVRYNHEYSAAVGNTKTTGTMESHTILVTANIGWQFLYQAVLQ